MLIHQGLHVRQRWSLILRFLWPHSSCRPQGALEEGPTCPAHRARALVQAALPPPSPASFPVAEPEPLHATRRHRCASRPVFQD